MTLGSTVKNKTAQNDNVLTAVNPATGKVVHQFDCDSAADVERKIAKAQDAYQSWRKTSFAERAALLKKVASILREKNHEYGEHMTVEMGKPVQESLGEVEKAAWCAEHYADNAESYLETEVLASDATKSYVQYMPLGPVLGILPWNAPFWLAFRFCAPALMAGNTCLMKHDPHVPACARAIEEALELAGAPDGLFQSLYLQTPAVEAVIRDDRVQAVSFTGSSRGGAAVASIAASEIKPAVLELGGSDPCVVLADADKEKAAEIIRISRIINAGQSCIAAKRIIVEAPIYDEMVDLIEKQLATLKVGDPTDKDNHVGPIARPDLRDNLHRQVQETIDQGAVCVMGGTLPDGDGYFYPVTLLKDVTPDMCAYREETFGPVAVIIKADNAAQALEMANDTPYGLGASVWTADTAKGEEMAREIVAGQVSVNGIVKTDPRLPSGGVKKSGYGRELGPHGIREFTNAQQIWVGPVKS